MTCSELFARLRAFYPNGLDAKTGTLSAHLVKDDDAFEIFHPCTCVRMLRGNPDISFDASSRDLRRSIPLWRFRNMTMDLLYKFKFNPNEVEMTVNGRHVIDVDYNGITKQAFVHYAD